MNFYDFSCWRFIAFRTSLIVLVIKISKTLLVLLSAFTVSRAYIEIKKYKSK